MTSTEHSEAPKTFAAWVVRRKWPLVEIAALLALYATIVIPMASGDSNGMGYFQQPRGNSLWAPLILGGAVNAGVMWFHAFRAMPFLAQRGARGQYLVWLAGLLAAYFLLHLFYQLALSRTQEPNMASLTLVQWTAENARAMPWVFIFSALYKVCRDWVRHHGERVLLMDRASSLETELALIRSEVDQLKSERDAPAYLRIESNRQQFQIPHASIKFVRSAGNYLEITTPEKTHTAYGALKDLLQELPAGRFIQIHRSYIVNLDAISAIKGKMIEIDGSELPVGDRHKKSFLEAWANRG